MKSWRKVVVCFSFHGAQLGHNSKSSNVGHCIETCFGRDLDFCVDNCGFWMEVMQKWNCNLILFCNQNNKIFWYPYKQHKKVTCPRSSSYFSYLTILPKFLFELAWDHRRWGEGALGRGRKGRRQRRGEYLGARRTWTIMRAMMRISEEINQWRESLHRVWRVVPRGRIAIIQRSGTQPFRPFGPCVADGAARNNSIHCSSFSV